MFIAVALKCQSTQNPNLLVHNKLGAFFFKIPNLKADLDPSNEPLCYYIPHSVWNIFHHSPIKNDNKSSFYCLLLAKLNFDTIKKFHFIFISGVAIPEIPDEPFSVG